MSKATEFNELTPEQQRYVIQRYPNDTNRADYIYEVSEKTGRFMCRHRKPKFTSQKTK